MIWVAIIMGFIDGIVEAMVINARTRRNLPAISHMGHLGFFLGRATVVTLATLWFPGFWLWQSLFMGLLWAPVHRITMNQVRHMAFSRIKFDRMSESSAYDYFWTKLAQSERGAFLLCCETELLLAYIVHQHLL